MSLLVIGLCGQSVFLSVPHFHLPEETLHASSLFTEPGGKGYNQAIAARRMGADTVFAGAVGPDPDGDACERRLTDERVRPCLFTKAGHTSFASILTCPTGENRVTVYSGAELSPDDIRQLEPRFAEAGMILLTPEIPEAAFAEAMRLASRHQVRTVINPAPYFPFITPFLRSAWLLTPNRSEACALLSCTPEDLMDAIPRAPYPRLIVTLGSEGAVCLENGVPTRIPAPVTEAVDTTGAGDCFNGALCAFLLKGYSLTEAAAYAVRAASLSVSRAHVLDGLPFRHELNVPETD